jgi:uncharacterized protein YndB with AHSA1/START domain
MRSFEVSLAVLLSLTCAVANAEVVDSASGGFTIKTTVNLKATPEDVYHKLIQNVGDWWNSGHTYSQDAHNLSIEEKPMGCFCEKLKNGGSVRHMQVVFLSPGKVLGLTGALGPLQNIAATGNMQFAMSPVDGGTKLELTYAVTGYVPAGMNTWAAPVDGVLKEQLTRFKNYVEHGDPSK